MSLTVVRSMSYDFALASVESTIAVISKMYPLFIVLFYDSRDTFIVPRLLAVVDFEYDKLFVVELVGILIFLDYVAHIVVPESVDVDSFVFIIDMHN